MSDLTVDGMALAPGVVETIVSIAVADVDGVASVGNAPAASRGIRGVLGGKPSTSGIEIAADENDKLQISVRIDVYYGHVLPDVAAAVRQSVADAVASQVGRAGWIGRRLASTASSSTVRNKKKHRGLFAHGIEKTRAHDGTSRRAAGSVHRRDQGRIRSSDRG